MTETFKMLFTKAGEKILVDEEDYSILSKYSWYVDGRGYAVAHFQKSIVIPMHRLILGVTDPKLQGDHINGNKLDNRKSNLRVVSNKQNQENLHKKKGFTSRYIGVHLDKRENLTKRWVAYIKTQYKNQFLGRFLTEDEAALAYNKKAEELGYLTRNKVEVING